jgi:hypothetical protein
LTARAPVTCVAALSGLLWLTGCAPQAAEQPAPELPVPPVPPPAPVRRPANPTIHTSWTFSTSGEECAAEASAAGTTLQIVVQRNVPMRLNLVSQSLSLRSQASVPLRFNGAAGSWRIAGRATGPHTLAAPLGSDEVALSHVVVLLSGGLLEVGEAGATLATIDISPSEKNGQTWFDCARSKVL